MSTRQNKDLRVADVMLGLDEFPIVQPTLYLKTALEEMGKWRLGIVCISDADGKLLGIFTDGDVRRKLLDVQKPFSALFSDDIIDHAIVDPTVAQQDWHLMQAVQIMEDKGVWDLPVVDTDGKLSGLLHLHPVVKILMAGQA